MQVLLGNILVGLDTFIILGIVLCVLDILFLLRWICGGIDTNLAITSDVSPQLLKLG